MMVFQDVSVVVGGLCVESKEHQTKEVFHIHKDYCKITIMGLDTKGHLIWVSFSG